MANIIIDGGCTHYVTNDYSSLDDVVQSQSDLGRISGRVPTFSVRVMGYGTIAGLRRVLYALNIAKNLIPVSQLTTNGFNISFI
jgi:hypothetical protein